MVSICSRPTFRTVSPTVSSPPRREMILEISNGERASRALSIRDDPVNSQSQKVVRTSPSNPHSTPYSETESPPLGNKVCHPPGDGSALCPYRVVGGGGAPRAG